MFHVWWPATAFLTIFVMFIIFIILIYGDVCLRGRGGGRPGRVLTSVAVTRDPREAPRSRPEEPYRLQRPPRPPQSLPIPSLQQQQFHHQQQQRYDEAEYDEREIGGMEMQQQEFHKVSYSREVEV